MDILLIGNTSQISEGFLNKLPEDSRIIIYDTNAQKKYKKKNLTYIDKHENGSDELRKIYTAFNFEAVIYISFWVNGEVAAFYELEKLEENVYYSKRTNVQQFIYVNSNDMIGKSGREVGAVSRGVYNNACEEMCISTAEEKRIKFKQLKIPYLYSMESLENPISKWTLDVIAGRMISYSGYRDTEFDCLCDEDLGELIIRMLDDPGNDFYNEVLVTGENPMSFDNLIDLYKKEGYDCRVSFHNEEKNIPQYKKNEFARKMYGFYPTHKFENDLADIISYVKKSTVKKKSVTEKRVNRKKIWEKIRKTVELFVLFGLSLLLNHWTRNNVLLNFLDFRIVFVIIMGTMNGLLSGVLAAILASLTYGFIDTNPSQWQIVFYNIENWLPFACYFMLGAITGYYRDTHDDEIIYANEEYKILENKYIFIGELYNKVMESKDSFNRQIIGFNDSFGKIYSVVKRLDTTLQDGIFLEAVNVLEELLDSRSVAIYAINENSSFARLNVCSKGLSNTLSKSLKITDYPEMISALEEKKIFKNIDSLPGYPQYASPIVQDGKLIGMIQLLEANEKQLNMEYHNKFSIISDLIRDSLIRAIEYDQMAGEYIDGTSIIKKERFSDILAVKKQIKGQQLMDYVLVKIIRESEAISDVGNKVAKLIRNSDQLGIGEDGELYLLLNQTRDSDLEIIRDRMNSNNIKFELVRG